MIRVRFLRQKRYPHPNGRRREVGEIVMVDPDTASRWEPAGLLEYVDAKPPTETVELENMTVAELRELATQHGVDLGKRRKKADIVDAITAHIEAETADDDDEGNDDDGDGDGEGNDEE